MDKIVLPLADDELWKFIDDESMSSKIYQIDVLHSYHNLKENLLYYISNLGMNVQFDFHGCDYSIKSSVIEQYFKILKLFEQHQMLQTVAALLMCFKRIEVDCYGIFDKSEANKWISDHIDLIETSAQFMDSIMLFLLVCFDQANNKNANDRMFNIDQYPHIQTSSISVNLPLLTNYVDFAQYYGTVNPADFVWYDLQFTQPIYDERSLAQLIFTDNNIIVALCWDTVTSFKDNKNVSPV